MGLGALLRSNYIHITYIMCLAVMVSSEVAGLEATDKLLNLEALNIASVARLREAHKIFNNLISDADHDSYNIANNHMCICSFAAIQFRISNKCSHWYVYLNFNYIIYY